MEGHCLRRDSRRKIGEWFVFVFMVLKILCFEISMCVMITTFSFFRF